MNFDVKNIKILERHITATIPEGLVDLEPPINRLWRSFQRPIKFVLDLNKSLSNSIYFVIFILSTQNIVLKLVSHFAGVVF